MSHRSAGFLVLLALPARALVRKDLSAKSAALDVGSDLAPVTRPGTSLLQADLESDTERVASMVELSTEEWAAQHQADYEKDFTIQLDMTPYVQLDKVSIGADLYSKSDHDPLTISGWNESGPVAAWNKAHPDQAVQLGDEIARVSTVVWNHRNREFIRHIKLQLDILKDENAEGEKRSVLELVLQRPRHSKLPTESAAPELADAAPAEVDATDVGKEEFTVELNIIAQGGIGAELYSPSDRDPLTISTWSESGPVAVWNKAHPDQAVQVGDEVTKVSDVSWDHRNREFLRLIKQQLEAVKEQRSGGDGVVKVVLQRPKSSKTVPLQMAKLSARSADTSAEGASTAEGAQGEGKAEVAASTGVASAAAEAQREGAAAAAQPQEAQAQESAEELAERQRVLRNAMQAAAREARDKAIAEAERARAATAAAAQLQEGQAQKSRAEIAREAKAVRNAARKAEREAKERAEQEQSKEGQAQETAEDTAQKAKAAESVASTEVASAAAEAQREGAAAAAQQQEGQAQESAEELAERQRVLRNAMQAAAREARDKAMAEAERARAAAAAAAQLQEGEAQKSRAEIALEAKAARNAARKAEREARERAEQEQNKTAENGATQEAQAQGSAEDAAQKETTAATVASTEGAATAEEAQREGAAASTQLQEGQAQESAEEVARKEKAARNAAKKAEREAKERALREAVKRAANERKQAEKAAREGREWVPAERDAKTKSEPEANAKAEMQADAQDAGNRNAEREAKEAAAAINAEREAKEAAAAVNAEREAKEAAAAVTKEAAAAVNAEREAKEADGTDSTEFTIELNLAEGHSIGAELYSPTDHDPLVVSKWRAGSPVEAWNTAHPDKALQVGDEITKVNDIAWDHHNREFLHNLKEQVEILKPRGGKLGLVIKRHGQPKVLAKSTRPEARNDAQLTQLVEELFEVQINSTAVASMVAQNFNTSAADTDPMTVTEIPLESPLYKYNSLSPITPVQVGDTVVAVGGSMGGSLEWSGSAVQFLNFFNAVESTMLTGHVAKGSHSVTLRMKRRSVKPMMASAFKKE